MPHGFLPPDAAIQRLWNATLTDLDALELHMGTDLPTLRAAITAHYGADPNAFVCGVLPGIRRLACGVAQQFEASNALPRLPAGCCATVRLTRFQVGSCVRQCPTV